MRLRAAPPAPRLCKVTLDRSVRRINISIPFPSVILTDHERP